MWTRRELRATSGAVATTIGAVLPVFLVGAVGPHLRDDLQFGRRGLGFSIAICQATSATMCWGIGRRIVGIGTIRAIRWSAAFSGVSLLGIALLARSWLTLTMWLSVSGVAGAMGQPATNALLLEAVAPSRLGRAFGVKLAATPLGALLVGLLVPLVAVPLGWRWTFGVGIIVLVVAVRLVPRDEAAIGPAGRRWRAPSELPRPATPWPALALLAGGIGLAIGMVNVVPAFFVESAVASGIGSGTAGVLLAVGGVAGVAARIGVGVRVDGRARTGIDAVAVMVAAGSAGLALLSGSTLGARTTGVVIVFAVGWGWVGLFHYLLSSANRANPGAATGLTDTGGYLGSSAGPAMAGIVAERWSFAAVWRLTAVAAIVGAALIHAGGVVARRAGAPIEVAGTPLDRRRTLSQRSDR